MRRPGVGVFQVEGTRTKGPETGTRWCVWRNTKKAKKAGAK